MMRSAIRNQMVCKGRSSVIGRVVEPCEALDGRKIGHVGWGGGRQRGGWIPGRREAAPSEAAIRELLPTLLRAILLLDPRHWPEFNRLRLLRHEDGCCQSRHDESTGLGVERRLANDRVGGMLLHRMRMQFQTR
jgi:hypothetical protein